MLDYLASGRAFGNLLYLLTFLLQFYFMTVNGVLLINTQICYFDLSCKMHCQQCFKLFISEVKQLELALIIVSNGFNRDLQLTTIVKIFYRCLLVFCECCRREYMFASLKIGY